MCMHSHTLVVYSSRHRCVEYGVLPHDEAERVYQLVLERKRKGGSSIAVSSSSTPKKKKKKKPTIVKDEGVDPDMQVSGGDAIGKAVL